MYNKQFSLGQEIIEHIESYGYQAYFVGGCVRDLLLERPIKDIDIATSALPDFVISIFDKVIPLGLEHGTVIVRHQGESFEVTTFRLDGTYSDSRHPDHVDFIDNVELDLRRRDFTINALAMNKHGDIIDLFKGKADLGNKLIKAVGDDELRFQEDALRIMRAIRFSSQLGFSIDKRTLEAMNKIKEKLKDVAIERVKIEMEKLIMGDYIDNGFYYLQITEVYKYLPVLKDYPEILDMLPTKLQKMSSFSEWIALCHFINPGLTIRFWTKSWKASNKTENKAKMLSTALHYYDQHQLDSWLVYGLKQDCYDSFIRLTNMLFDAPVNEESFHKEVQKLPILSKKELTIKGQDLINMFPECKPGPWIKECLNQIEKQVVLRKIKNNVNSIKEWIKWNPPEIN